MFGGLLAGLAFWPFSGKLELTRGGRTDYAVVQAENATEPEKFAVQELTNFLSRVTGATFPVIEETALSGNTRGIYVGWTSYAERNGIDASKLGEEEWVIRSIGKNLVLAGGRPRGTMYAVYEFLERQVGCHWLDQDTEVVPSKPDLKLGKLDIRAKPAFARRELSNPGLTARGTRSGMETALFHIRNKTFRYDLLSLTNLYPHGAFSRWYGSPSECHTFEKYLSPSNWFATHPEYFALDARGKRAPVCSVFGSPAQLCLTQPDVRRLVVERLREFIARDRAEAALRGVPTPKVYDISQNDNSLPCQCTNCQSIAAREGGESGPMIDFINAVAKDIEKDYPDILVQTFAYGKTLEPPRTIKPRSNVIVRWCDNYGKGDLVRPLSHPYNDANEKSILAWGNLAAHLAIWDYWIFFGGLPQFPLPYCMIQSIGPDLKLFADCHAETFFAESPAYIEAGENFTALKFWLAFQLMVNPYQPDEPLIEIFMDGYYGAASRKMREYLAYLQGRIDREAGYMESARCPWNLKYLDAAFFQTAEKLFDEAEAMVPPDSLEAWHVRRERFIVDGALLQLWPWLNRKLAAGEKMPFDHEVVIRRYEANWRMFMKHEFHWFYIRKDRLEALAAFFRDPQLPERFRKLPSRDVADFNWLCWRNFEERYFPMKAHFVSDPEAAGGLTLARVNFPDAEAKQLLKVEMTDRPGVTIPSAVLHQDGIYHSYRVGRMEVGSNSVVQTLGGSLHVNVDRLWESNTAYNAANEWHVYLSMKVKGPAFVKGSTETNGIWIDRVLLVKPQPGEKPDAVELLRREEKKKIEVLRAVPPPQVRVPRAPAGAAGDPIKVDWDKAARTGAWSTLMGAATSRKVEARVAQDGEHLYFCLKEELDPTTLKTDTEIFGGDDWELLFAAERGAKSYRQIGINPKGEHMELAHGQEGGKWDSGVKVVSETGSNSWQVCLSIPLDRLAHGGVKPGQNVYVNMFRGGANPAVWSPVFSDSFHALDRLGEFFLEVKHIAALVLHSLGDAGSRGASLRNPATCPP